MKPRKAKTLVVNDEVSSGLRQTIELFANLGKQSGEVGKTLLFRFDHLSRGAGNKAFVAKFGFALGDFAFEAGDFLRETASRHCASGPAMTSGMRLAGGSCISLRRLRTASIMALTAFMRASASASRRASSKVG